MALSTALRSFYLLPIVLLYLPPLQTRALVPTLRAQKVPKYSSSKSLKVLSATKQISHQELVISNVSPFEFVAATVSVEEVTF